MKYFAYQRSTCCASVSALLIITLAASLSARPSQAQPASPSALLDGVGILSDSNLDEYQGTDNRGGSYHSHTFNMIELLVLLRGFNLGDWGTYPEPRRAGFEYDWARSGATSSTLISAGQHTGLAAQVAAGEVTFVILHIGSNDFSPYANNAYQEACYMSDNQLQDKVNTAIANVTLATDTILDAGPEGMIVTLFPYWDDLDPIVLVACPEPARRQRIRDAVDDINQGILDMAETRPIVIVNPADVVLPIYAGLENGFLDVGGELIDFAQKGDEPHHAQLEDASGHAGTVLSGLLANGMWIEPLNQHFGANIAPLSDEEILQAAGINTVSRPHHIYVPLVTRN
jgi:hypothetical protein